MGYIVAILIVLVIYYIYIKEHLIINSHRKVTLHYTNWCGYCKQMRPIWDRVVRSSNGNGIIFEEVDEEKAKNPYITAYPTILMVGRDGRVLQYSGEPDFEKLRAWVLAPLPKK